jgi:hypothetical protein
MSSAQKIPFARAINNWAQQKALDEIIKRGLALPGVVSAVSGAIITVKFQVSGLAIDPVTMPLAGPQYIRFPIQVGDLGVAIPASVYLGGVSGLGGGIADMTQRGNLSTLFWVPLGNANWTAPPGSDANTLTMYGHLALLLLDSITGNSSVKLTATGLTLTFGTSSVTINASGITLTNGAHTVVINSTGVVIDGVIFAVHEHLPGTYVAGSTPVTGDSGAVV